jgi:hypothetical protein
MPINGLRLSAKFAGSGVRHTWQTRIPLGPWQSGHGASRWGSGDFDSGGGKVGQEALANPVSRCLISSTDLTHRARPGAGRPVHWKRSLATSIR